MTHASIALERFNADAFGIALVLSSVMTNIDLDDLARVTGGSVAFPTEPSPTTGPTFPRPSTPPCDPGPCRPPQDPPFGSPKGFPR